MIDDDVLIPLRFKVEPVDDDLSFDQLLHPTALHSVKYTTYTIEIKVLDLRNLQARTLNFETDRAVMRQIELPDLTYLRTDHHDYLRQLRDRIDEVLGE